MRTAVNLFRRLCNPDHLEAAADATVRGKRRRGDVAWFLFDREEVMEELRASLLAGRYSPHACELVRIRDPKPRLIARVPITDRILHTALVLLMEPVFLRTLRPEAYACRKGYGTHRAVLRLLELTRRYGYFLHLDIRSYFPSIVRGILRRLLAERIRDDSFLEVVDRVLSAGVGLYDRPDVRRAAQLDRDWPPPGRGIVIGSYTSQLFAAHVYLNAFDHFVKRTLKVPGYVRYVDDLFLFGDRRAEMLRWREAVAGWLDVERGLRLKRPGARVRSCGGCLDALGFRISRAGLRARPLALRRLKKRLALELAGAPGPDFDRSVSSRAGILLF